MPYLCLKFNFFNTKTDNNMRKFALLLLGFYFTNLHAQLPTVQQYQTQQAIVLQNSLATLKADNRNASDLEMLYDKVTPFAGLSTYNDPDNNISKASLFKQALSELYRTSDKLKFESFESLENRLKTNARTQQTAATLPYYNTVVKMGIINTPISHLNYNSEFPNDGGLKLINGIYTPANNLPAFIQKQITMVSPLEELIYTKDNSINYQFNTTEIYQWGNKKIATMTADFGNGTIYTLMQNQTWVQNSIVVNYTTIDENKKLVFNITYTDGTTLTTYAGISIGKDNTASTSPTARVASTSGLMRHTSTIAYTDGSLGQLEYRIFYGDQNTNNTLKKPFIIVDGFDPGDKRKIVVEDCDVNCQKLFKPFIRTKYESIEVLMMYNNQTSDLKTKLTALNYDVIIVNFPTYTNNLGQIIDGGADDIFRNGRTVASFLQKINADIKTNGSNEKLVLVGPSMGGQITRYALAYMEKKQQETSNAIWDHNTRIYLSMDSPHQGATIPLSTQGDLYFLGELLEKEEARSKYRDVIKSKAARQMLLTIAGPQSNFYNTEHDVYNQELITNGITGSKGYPVMNGIRKLAIANGSMSGVRNVNPSEKFYEVVALVKLRSILTFGIRIAKKPVFRINNWFMPDKNSTSTLLQNFSQEPSQAINWNNTNNLSMGSLDAVPGGSFNAANDLKNEVYDSLKGTNGFTSPYGLFPLLWTGEKLIVEQRIPNSIDTAITPQAFIPTHSALDTKGFADWYQPIDRNLVCTGQTPFNSFYGENTNMGHITFTDNMVKWLLEELKGNPQLPSFPMQENLLTGTNVICSNTNTTYQIDACKVPSQATFTVQGNLTIIGSNTGYSLTVQATSDIGSSSTITATFQNGQTITKSVWTGKPSFTVVKSQYNPPTIIDVNLSGLNGVDINTQGITSVLWEKILNNPVNCGDIISDNGFSNEISYYGYTCSTSMKITATNNCGSTIVYKTIVGNYKPGDAMKTASTKTFYIYPNPSKDIVNIDLLDPNNQPVKGTKISGELFDMIGQSKSKVEIKENKSSFSVRGLNKGIYVLKISIEGKEESHQIAVE